MYTGKVIVLVIEITLFTVRQFCDAALSETNLGELHARMKDLLEEAFTVSRGKEEITHDDILMNIVCGWLFRERNIRSNKEFIS